MDHLSVRLNHNSILFSGPLFFFFNLFNVSQCFLIAEKKHQNVGYASSHLVSPGIVSDSEMLSDKVQEQLVVGEAARWFSVTVLNCSCFRFTTSISVDSRSFFFSLYVFQLRLMFTLFFLWEVANSSTPLMAFFSLPHSPCT